jgi:hypothetical protein
MIRGLGVVSDVGEVETARQAELSGAIEDFAADANEALMREPFGFRGERFGGHTGCGFVGLESDGGEWCFAEPSRH